MEKNQYPYITHKIANKCFLNSFFIFSSLLKTKENSNNNNNKMSHVRNTEHKEAPQDCKQSTLLAVKEEDKTMQLSYIEFERN